MKAVFIKKVTKMAHIFQEQNDKKLAQRVFPALIEVTYKNQIIEHLNQERVKKYAQFFIGFLRRKLLMKEMMEAYFVERCTRTQRNVFAMLLEHCHQQK